MNNTHLCGETTPQEVREGAALAEAVSRETGIPVICHAAEARFAEQLQELALFPIELRMKKPWE